LILHSDSTGDQCRRDLYYFPEARFSTASEALKSLDYFGIAAWSWAMPQIAEQMLSGLCAIYVVPARKSARGRDYRVRCPPS
jgi:hypothetical protein